MLWTESFNNCVIIFLRRGAIVSILSFPSQSVTNHCLLSPPLADPEILEGGGAEDKYNVSALQSYFIANAHNELYAFLRETRGLMGKIS